MRGSGWRGRGGRSCNGGELPRSKTAVLGLQHPCPLGCSRQAGPTASLRNRSVPCCCGGGGGGRAGDGRGGGREHMERRMGRWWGCFFFGAFFLLLFFLLSLRCHLPWHSRVERRAGAGGGRPPLRRWRTAQSTAWPLLPPPAHSPSSAWPRPPPEGRRGWVRSAALGYSTARYGFAAPGSTCP